LAASADFLRPFIWSRVSSLMRFREWIRKRNSFKFCANLGKSAKEILAMIRQTFGGENEPYRVGTLISGQTENGEECEEQSQEHAHNFL
jgi:hypothetical protein